MNKLFEYADEYIEQSSWKDFAALKLCLASLGVLIGISLPQRALKAAKILASIVFAVTYVPLMTKFFRIVLGKSE